MVRKTLVAMMIVGLVTGLGTHGPGIASAAPADAHPVAITTPSAAPKGTLIIAGGGALPNDVFKAFVAAAGGRGAHVAVLPVASSVPKETVADLQGSLTALGAHLHVLDIRQRSDSDLPALLQAAGTCSGFWFTGGDQNRIGDFIVGTALHRLIAARYQSGAVIGGTSAGAAAMSRIMLTGDGALSETAPGSFKTREGLGFLPGCIVDQHFLRRQRHNRLLSLIQEHPDHLGLGIDEETALQVHDGKATVIGNRRVLVIDPRQAMMTAGTMSHLQVHLLGAGQAVVLNTRVVSPTP